MICFWHKKVTGLDTKLSYRLLYLLNKLYEQNLFKSPWLTFVENTLNSCGMGTVWLNPNVINHEWLKKSITLKLTDMSKQEWRNEMATKSSCTIYRSYKTVPELETYQTLLDNVDRINMFKFRCRNLKIPVVVYGEDERNIPYDDRLCTKCTMNVIGDEYHYIIQCPFFQHHRQRLLENHFYTNPNMEKFCRLFQTKNANIIRKLAKLITEITRSFR